jgi:catechol 2,3-dioxygenase-like lactoylglutathione lyase family enzyme
MRRAWVFVVCAAVSCFAWAQQRPAITGIAFVRVYASDMAASDTFYAKTIGLKGTKSGDIVRYDVSDSQWVEVKPLPSPAPASRLEAVAFTTRDAAGMEKYLKAHGVAIVEPLKGGVFGVKDPEGNLILFVQEGTKVAGVPAASATATSHRIIHAGLMVRDRAAEDKFYKDLLGFTPYWAGGPTPEKTNWVSQQVPDGSDWLEYMLNVSATPSLKELGVVDHMALGTVHMSDVVAQLAKNGCQGPNCTASKMGADGKVQLNMYDPDLTRIEFMEFEPSGPVCCSPFTGKHPTETESK